MLIYCDDGLEVVSCIYCFFLTRLKHEIRFGKIEIQCSAFGFSRIRISPKTDGEFHDSFVKLLDDPMILELTAANCVRHLRNIDQEIRIYNIICIRTRCAP